MALVARMTKESVASVCVRDALNYRTVCDAGLTHAGQVGWLGCCRSNATNSRAVGAGVYVPSYLDCYSRRLSPEGSWKYTRVSGFQ